MVYSSDFYTSRRPAYYKPATSYSVTPLYSSDGYDLPPSYYKAHQVYQTCTTPTPFILTPPHSTGKPSPNVLPYNSYPYTHHHYVPMHRRSAATMHGVLDKIEHRPRAHPSYDPTDEYLNSRNATNFDDVTRDIRAQTAGLLKQVYTPTIRPKISSVSNGYSEVPIASRIESDAYIEKILADSDSYRRDNSIGKGHLACVSYAGGKAYPRRRPHLSKEVDDNITMLSYYNKTREAVAASSTLPAVKINNKGKQTMNQKEHLQSDLNITEKKAEADREATRLAAKEKEVMLKAEKDAARIVAENEAAEKELARLAAEKETAQLLATEKEAAEKEAARLAAEEKAAQLEAEKEAARLVAKEETARLLAAEKEAAEQEAARILAENEAARLAAETEAARLASEEEAARLAAEEEAARLEAEKDGARLAAEEETARLLAAEEFTKKNAIEEIEKTQQVANDYTSEEDIEESEQQLQLDEKTTKDISSEVLGTNTAAFAESSTTTTSTEIINEDGSEVKATAIFQRTITKTTTIKSSTSAVTSENDGDSNSTVEINEVIEDGNDSAVAEEKNDTEHQDAAQAEGQVSSEEEDESECEESEEE